jgi:MEMO1 family protein
MERMRPPAVAGSFYPSNAAELADLLDECFSTSPLGPRGRQSPTLSLIAGVAPHAGYRYSGPCAAHLYARFPDTVEHVIIVGVNHWARGHRAALSPADAWQTPIGSVPVNQEINAILEHRVHFLKKDELAHAREHSIEVQLPFLQRVLRPFTFVPISLSDVSTAECSELGSAVAEVCKSGSALQDKTIVVASTDLSHYLSPRKTNELDQIALERVLHRDPAGLLNVVDQENISMCGVRPTAVMLYAANQLGVTEARLLKHCHSGDVAPMRKVVGYASVAFER